ncbi:MAG TPA: DUF4350 domain-containing protein [Acidisarcina sp.]
MRILPSLNPRDRNAVLLCLGLVMVMIVAIALFSPRERDDSPVPSTYGAGTHGAKAAYLLLARSGYNVQRWEQPLANLGNTPDSQLDEHTVLVLAEPFFTQTKEAKHAVRNVLSHGGRVLTTGSVGSYLIPNGQAAHNTSDITSTVCHATREGLDTLSSSGEVDLESPVVWSTPQPLQRIQYRCGTKPVVVAYHADKGNVIWWASSTPLENGSILRSGNLDLLLNSIGSPATAHIIWDESLHGDARTPWSYTGGTPMRLLWLQVAIIAALLLFSLSRRSGPLRVLAETPRSTPVEFVESLGALYDKAGASSTAVVIAHERFRHQVEKRLGFTSGQTTLPAPELAQAIQARLHYNHPELAEDLAECETAAHTELSRRRALQLVQALHDHSERMSTIGHNSPEAKSAASAVSTPNRTPNQGRT